MSNPVFGHGRFRDLDTQLQQFAMDARRTRARIVAAQHPNQKRFLVRGGICSELFSGRGRSLDLSCSSTSTSAISL